MAEFGEDTIREWAISRLEELSFELDESPTGVIPFDQGILKDSLEVDEPFISGDTARLGFRFTAVHGPILENSIVIRRPTRASASGRRVVTEIDNRRHFRWWSNRYLPYVEDLLRNL